VLNVEHLNQLKQELNTSTLVAVTKYVGISEIQSLLDEGIHDFGENRVDVFLKKYHVFENQEITWHFIGHLQSKKAKKVIHCIDYLHSLESLSLAEEIQKRRETPLDCFLEVNISGETQKYGLLVEDVISFYEKLRDYDKIHVIGLMGMASHTDNQTQIKQQFQRLVDLKTAINQKYHQMLRLSMGMSNDYQLALSMGSDYIRIGSFLFEEDK